MPRMRRLLLASLIAAAGAAAPSAQDAELLSTASSASSSGVITPPLSPRNASYTITARLDPAARTIAGSETITWRNITTKPAADLQFHLYWNAWKNTRSTFMRERALGASGEDRPRRPSSSRWPCARWMPSIWPRLVPFDPPWREWSCTIAGSPMQHDARG